MVEEEEEDGDEGERDLSLKSRDDVGLRGVRSVRQLSRTLGLVAAGVELVLEDTRSLFRATPARPADVLVSLACTIRAFLGPSGSVRQCCECESCSSVK